MLEKVNQVISFFGYAENVNESQIAREIMKFSSQEMNMLKIFWEPVFNKSWIILNRVLIKEWFCKNDKGKDSLNRFYNRILFKHFKEGKDYCEIQRDEYLKKYSPKMENTFVHPNSRFFKVTGECLKEIGMMRNNEIREYYLKVEKLSFIMTKYLFEVNNFQLQKKDEKISQQEEKIINMKRFVDHVQIQPRNEWIYIATTKVYAANNHFKIGSTTRLRSRLNNYQIGRTSTDKMFYVWIFKCYNSKKLEDMIKSMLSQFLEKEKKEMYIMHFEDLVDLVNFICHNYENSTEYVNTFIHERLDSSIKKTPIVPEAIQIEKTTLTIGNIYDEETKNFDLTTMSDKEKEDLIRIRLNLFSSGVVSRKEILKPYSGFRNEMWNILKKVVHWKNSKTQIPDLNLIISY